MVNNNLPAKAPVETKVKVATVATYVGTGLLLALIQMFAADPVLQGTLPVWLTPFLVPLLPTVVTALSTYRADHTPRPDLAAPVPPADPPAPETFSRRDTKGF